MKYLFIALAAVLAFSVIYLLVFTDVIVKHRDETQKNNPDEVLDGYLRDSSKDSPKNVNSSQIDDFSLVFSTLSWADEQYFKEGIYCFEIKAENGSFRGKYEFNPYYGNREIYLFDTDQAFMQKLDKVVKKYDLADFNGKNIFVSGLPDMYGEEIRIVYASGESIYASDNQDGFINRQVLLEFERLFSQEAEMG